MSNFDEDYRKTHPQASISKYFADAWPDFIQHQLVPFGDLPVFLGIGNHELVAPMTRGTTSRNSPTGSISRSSSGSGWPTIPAITC